MRAKVILTALALIFLSSSIALSQWAGPWGRPFAKLWDELKLTDEQKSKIQSLWFEHQKRQSDVRSRLDRLQIELRELLATEKIDRSAVEKKIDEVARIRADFQKNAVDFWFKVQDVLTPEQKKIFRDRVGAFGFGMKFGRGFRGFGMRLHCPW